jgi:nitrite reductase/ring-hydroxylating ferredoxin subunit
MAQDQAKPSGPNLVEGVPLSQLADGGKLVGHAGDEQVLLVRRGTEVFAVGAYCTHYHGPLVDGLLVGDTVRCPWHHACFALRTGEAVHAPALSPVACWSVEQRDGKVFVREKRAQSEPKSRGTPAGAAPEKIVVVGGGAAGFAAVEMLRRRQYQGSIVMLGSDDALPYDRPNLSKDYLAGSAPFDYVPLREENFYLEIISTRAWGKRLSRSTFVPVKSSSRAATRFHMTDCCWQPGPNRFVLLSLGPTSRMYAHFAR